MSRICVDVEHEFIRRQGVIPANVHDSQRLLCQLDQGNEHESVLVNSAYSGGYFQDLLAHAAFKRLIHKRVLAIILFALRQNR